VIFFGNSVSPVPIDGGANRPARQGCGVRDSVPAIIRFSSHLRACAAKRFRPIGLRCTRLPYKRIAEQLISKAECAWPMMVFEISYCGVQSSVDADPAGVGDMVTMSPGRREAC